MPSNGDTDREFKVLRTSIRGIGSFHKTLPHNEFGEVDQGPFQDFVSATRSDGSAFKKQLGGPAPFTNPQAGLAKDRLTKAPSQYVMPAAPEVLSLTTAAEFTELSWMALLRDAPLNQLAETEGATKATDELNRLFASAVDDQNDEGRLKPGFDVPDECGQFGKFTPHTLFRLGMVGELDGPMLSQFFIRPVAYGTQEIDQRQTPYRSRQDYLTSFPAWLHAQNTGQDADGGDYGKSNEAGEHNFEPEVRYISTMRDLARFVNKDALHQAYFNACLILLSGGARWTAGNPYRSATREAGFGTLGGPHILALVSEIATRALKIVWQQKWQVHLRLRPEAYGGLVHVQTVGVNGAKRPYCLPEEVGETLASQRIYARFGSRLLPMAFTAGSPAHPAYGAGHATVAGACVTVLKAFFETVDANGAPIPFSTLRERDRRTPHGVGAPIIAYETGYKDGAWGRFPLPESAASKLTIEGELNKLAQNVAMGRSMGGVHWRTDNTRSLILGEALAAKVLADIVKDLNETKTFPPAGLKFQFRTFGRRPDGKPKLVEITADGVMVDGDKINIDAPTSAL